MTRNSLRTLLLLKHAHANNSILRGHQLQILPISSLTPPQFIMPPLHQLLLLHLVLLTVTATPPAFAAPPPPAPSCSPACRPIVLIPGLAASVFTATLNNAVCPQPRSCEIATIPHLRAFASRISLHEQELPVECRRTSSFTLWLNLEETTVFHSCLLRLLSVNVTRGERRVVSECVSFLILVL